MLAISFRFALQVALGLIAVPALAFAAAPVAGRYEAASQPAEHNRAAQPLRNHQAQPATTLETVDVAARLDQARNALSPDIGSSQYLITEKDIQAMPLGESTPLNQVLLQAPGVVQDSYGQLHVRGDHANLQYRIDGVTVPESISGYGQTLDSHIIQNVKLLDGALPAQFGERTAAVVDITTKSGSRLGNGGNLGVTYGSYETLIPSASWWGHQGRWSWFLTGSYTENKRGMENPTSSRQAKHDRTHQGKAFGDLSYLINDQTRLSLLFGFANNRLQIPNIPDKTPKFGYLDRRSFDSSQLDENQIEKTRFAILSLQGKWGDTDYQISAGQRYSSVNFSPDHVGDLMFNGIASAVGRNDRATILQGDFSTPLGDAHTLRYGFYGNLEHAGNINHAWTFPANASGGQASTVPLQVYDNEHFQAKTWAAYVQDEWALGERWTLNYGLRADRYSAFRVERQLSPRVGLIWQAAASTTVHAGYARYFTPPASELVSARNIRLYDGTTNMSATDSNILPISQRDDYYDLGISQNIGQHLTLGLDGYYRESRRLQDDGQFGAAYIYSTFNYRKGRVRGLEFTANYQQGPLSAYFNFAYSKAQGKKVQTGQYNLGEDELAYIANHYVYLDHDQKFTSSGGVNWALAQHTRVGANYLFGSGLRTDTPAVPNGARLPYYFQLNFSLAQDFRIADTGPGLWHAQLAVINALDRSYQLRDGEGIGVGAPQWGPRRGFYVNLSKDF